MCSDEDPPCLKGPKTPGGGKDLFTSDGESMLAGESFDDFNDFY